MNTITMTKAVVCDEPRCTHTATMNVRTAGGVIDTNLCAFHYDEEYAGRVTSATISEINYPAQ